MSDLQSSVFSEIHRRWLKPMGFLKHGRKSEKLIGESAALAVTLERYPAQPGGPYHFSIELRATWDVNAAYPIIYCMYLPSYVTGRQYWTIAEKTHSDTTAGEVILQFAEFGVPTIHKMHSLDGLVELFKTIPQDVSLHWYFESFYRLLSRVGRREDAKAVLVGALDGAPNAITKQRASALLATHVTDAGASDA